MRAPAVLNAIPDIVQTCAGLCGVGGRRLLAAGMRFRNGSLSSSCRRGISAPTFVTGVSVLV